MLKTALYFDELLILLILMLLAFKAASLTVFQMEDGHTIFDYNVGLNDIVQLLVRQTLPAVSLPKDKEAELSDSDSGCGSGQSESDKNSTNGECEGQSAGTSAQSDLSDPGFGLYKVACCEPLASSPLLYTQTVWCTLHCISSILSLYILINYLVDKRVCGCQRPEYGRLV